MATAAPFDSRTRFGSTRQKGQSGGLIGVALDCFLSPWASIRPYDHAMPQSIPAGLTRDHILCALADWDAGAAHPFGTPTIYQLVYQGKPYAPKAIIGLACRYSIGRLLLPEEFSGGEAPGQANFVLRRLGFTVVPKDAETDAEPTSHKDWSAQE